jgi:Fe-S-cluster containining protein
MDGGVRIDRGGKMKKCVDIDCPDRILCCTTIRNHVHPDSLNNPDVIDWLLRHQGVSTGIDEMGSYISVTAPCKDFNPVTLRCEDYDERPGVCRSFKCSRMKGD